MKTEKKCFKCGVVKPISEFYKHKQMADGHLNKCKICTKNDVVSHREKNLEKVREYDRVRGKTQKRIRLGAAITKKYRERYPERYAANCKVNNALRDGRITKPSRCDGCGAEATLHAHHWSYEKEHQLDVEWLCAVCHKEMHADDGAF